MAFGSYDGSERENQRTDTDIDESDRSRLPDREYGVEFQYHDASSEDVLETPEALTGQ